MQRKKSILYVVALLVSAGLFAQSWWARDQSQASVPQMPSEAALFGPQAMPGAPSQQLPAMPSTEPEPSAPFETVPTAVDPSPTSGVNGQGPATGEQDWLLELDSWSQRSLELSKKPGYGSLEQLALLLEGRELAPERNSDPSLTQVPSTVVAGSVQTPTQRTVLPSAAMLSTSAEDRQILLALAEREPLQGVLHMGSTKSVLLGGRARQVGDAIGTSGATIEEIHARSVVLAKGRARLEIELGAPTRTPVAARHPSAQMPGTAVENELPPMPEIAVGASSPPIASPQP